MAPKKKYLCIKSATQTDMFIQYIDKYACVCVDILSIFVYINIIHIFIYTYTYICVTIPPPPDLPFQDVHANEQEPHSFRLDNLNVEAFLRRPEGSWRMTGPQRPSNLRTRIYSAGKAREKVGGC